MVNGWLIFHDWVFGRVLGKPQENSGILEAYSQNYKLFCWFREGFVLAVPIFSFPMLFFVLSRYLKTLVTLQAKIISVFLAYGRVMGCYGFSLHVIWKVDLVTDASSANFLVFST